MDKEEAEGASIERAEVNLCIFPHLREFLVIDLRRGLPGRPRLRKLNTGEVLTESFYDDLKEAFAAMLQEREQPFANLMALPPRLEAVVRQRSLAAILQLVNADVPAADTPRVAVLLCTDAILGLSPSQLAEAIEHILGPEAGQSLVQETLAQLRELVAQERTFTRRVEQEFARKAILGRGQEFFTLWEHKE